MRDSVYDGQPSPYGPYEGFYKPPPGSEEASPYPQPQQSANPHPYPQTQQQSGSLQDHYNAYRYSGAPPPVGQAAEVPAANLLGIGNNHAELG
ncbi:hypothetical protein DL768_008090 [Monosporascus sp. mg162]|nr:hypothetical protein DL768_008090 [Monosporascus sp. mg162]